jgi:co-chaperonin GroES (HSP10)
MPATEVGDIAELRQALAKFEPTLYKAMNKEIRMALRVVQKSARALVPAELGSGLVKFQGDDSKTKSRTSRTRAFPKYDAEKAKKGIVVSIGKSKRNNNGFVSYYSIINRSAAGQIIETAGRKNPSGSSESQSNNPNAGNHFINVLNHNVGSLGKYGKGRKNSGRIIYRAAEEDQGKTRDAIMRILAKAREELVLGH